MQPKIYPCPVIDCTCTFISKRGVRDHVLPYKETYDAYLNTLYNLTQHVKDEVPHGHWLRILLPETGCKSELYMKGHKKLSTKFIVRSLISK